MKKSVFLAVALAAALAGCASGVKLDDVPVESRSTTAGTPTTPGGQTQVQPVQADTAAGSQVGPVNVARTIYFDYDSYSIKAEYQSVVEAHARYLKQNGKSHVVIEGHTDERGGREYNLALGQKRSEAVRKALELLGVRDPQVEAVSFGKEKPAVQGADEAAWAKNRRAEIALPMMAMKRSALAAALVAASLFTASAQAALFEDDEARRAILDLRQQAQQQREELRRANEDNATLRRSLLELQSQIEALRSELAQQRGSGEQLARDIADLQKRQRDIAQGVDDRLRKFEPVQVTVDGREFTADPMEQREFEAALGAFRRGDFTAAQSAFAEFSRKYPGSGYRPTALFWLGNAQYANRDYKGAIANFRALLQLAPDHPRAPEAVLSIANCQIELKDNASARKTLDDLVKAYPQSEAASAARERLARLR